MSNTPSRPTGPGGLPFELEQLLNLRRWMLVLFACALLLSLATYWFWKNEGLQGELAQTLLAAALFATMATWGLMTRVAFLLHGWMLATMLAVASLLFQVLIPLGVIFLNYQVSDKLAEHKKQ